VFAQKRNPFATEITENTELGNAETGRALPFVIPTELVKTVAHVAFVVDDLDAAIAGKEILIEPNSPIEGLTVAFIVDGGAPIEFMQFDSPESEIWPPNAKYRVT